MSRGDLVERKGLLLAGVTPQQPRHFCALSAQRTEPRMGGAECRFDFVWHLALCGQHGDERLLARQALLGLNSAMADGLEGEIEFGHISAVDDRVDGRRAGREADRLSGLVQLRDG